MVWAAIDKTTGMTIATGNTASEANGNAQAQGFSPSQYTLIEVGRPPRA